MSGISIAIAAGLIGLLWQASEPVDAGLQQAIRAEIESPGGSDSLGTAGLVGEVYERRAFVPAWDNPERIQRLLEAVRASYDDGLSPSDYRLAGIEEVHQSVATGHELSLSERAEVDLMLTDSLIRLVYHLGYGKVDPATLKPSRAFERQLKGEAPSTVVEAILGSDDLVAAISSIRPNSPDYARLKAQLKQHRRIAETGGWPEVPSGPTIRPEANDPRLEILARRLAISGDLAAGAWAATGTYDQVLEDAVRRFQARHGLDLSLIHI